MWHNRRSISLFSFLFLHIVTYVVVSLNIMITSVTFNLCSSAFCFYAFYIMPTIQKTISFVLLVFACGMSVPGWHQSAVWRCQRTDKWLRYYTLSMWLLPLLGGTLRKASITAKWVSRSIHNDSCLYGWVIASAFRMCTNRICKCYKLNFCYTNIFIIHQ